jgi:serine/threonine protein kinase/tetratricopeptide (TPR) repeat protein
MASLTKVEAIFQAALEKASAEERAAYLEQACQRDSDLRRQVERLLHAQNQVGRFLEQPAAVEEATRDVVSGLWIDPANPPRPSEGPGSRIGPYKLLQQLGEGGMGAVYMAEQDTPVRRRVALKIIKPGMDSAQVIARFEAERQALALMDHQNIARVLDAGSTDSGRPYFVMELVKGIPITRFCDEQHLSPRERLELFVPVCQAIQHAHQKGIIHRDVKPSNVLVTLYDGKPVPKVIDFGVAKAIEQRLTERTLFTQLGQVVGTVEYMSPEQAELNALDIDTRSDIYSLGVLLYELLTGTTPLEKLKLRSAAFTEMLRMIREVEPPRPSTRLSTSGNRLPTISAQRKTEPAKLAKLVRGELDWIVMKALEKDRGRRYETANGLARDIQRYLADESVEACPPSATYKLRKFARKNRKLLITGGVFVLLLMAVALGGGWVLSDRSARQQATERAVNAALDEAALWQKQRRLPEALSAVRRADGLVRGGTADEALRRRVAARRADLELLAALDDARLEGAGLRDDHFDRARADAMFGDAFRAAGFDVEAQPAEFVAEQLRQTSVSAELAAALDDWATWRRASREDDSWQHLLAVAQATEPEGPAARVRDALRTVDGQRLVDLAASEESRDLLPPTLSALATALTGMDAGGEPAVVLLRAARQRHPDDFWLNEALGGALMGSPRLREEAIRYLTAAVSLRPDSPGAHLNLGVALGNQGQWDQAIAEYREAIRHKKDYAMAHNNLGSALQHKGDLDGAIAEYRQVLESQSDSPEVCQAHANLGSALRAKGRLDEAIAEYRKALRLNKDSAVGHNGLGNLLRNKGDTDGALAEYQAAIKCDARYSPALMNLGNTLADRGRLAEAEAAFHKTLEAKPDAGDAYTGLGLIWLGQGKLPEAVTAFHKAIDLWTAEPMTDYARADLAKAHAGLGSALSELGKPDEAGAAFRKAVELDPNHAEVQCNLGHLLLRQGRFAEALAALKRGHELGSKNPGWPYPSDQWVRQAEQFASLEGKLPKFLKGEVQPADATESIAVATCLRYKKMHAAATRFYARAFAAQPELGDNLEAADRYNAACAAALAGCGPGEDAAHVDDEERVRLRRQALTWLRADLAKRAKQAASSRPADRAAAQVALSQWLGDADLAGVRGDSLAKLPGAEAQAWRKLWADVADSLAQTRGPATTNKKASP